MSRRMGMIVLIVGIILALAAGLFMLSKKTVVPQTQQSTLEIKPSDSAENVITKSSIKDLLATGKNTSCKIIYPEQTSSGTIYVAGNVPSGSSPLLRNKFRGDFNVNVDGKEMASHMISDGEFAFIWTDKTKQGSKFKTEDLTKNAATESAKTQNTDINSQVNMDCSNWNVDNSKFIPPSDVNFLDMSSLMKQSKSSGIPKIDKSMCDQIPAGEAKDQCLSAINP